ncbi:anti-sigma factor RsbA family regulatory protein [Nonomuraea longicatena]|uniref:Sensor histidine kinase n=1 Tax=Nonomuraea longicatena TaxID=83682 RepID=A0ABN1NRI4_9ACTN
MLADPFSHLALLYRGDREYVTAVTAFVRRGLLAHEPVAVAVPAPRLALVEAALGPDAGKVRLIDLADAGRNPGRIIPAVLCEFADAHPGQRGGVVTEPVWPGRTALEYPACAQHEALTNYAFTGRAITVLCAYDAARLSPRVLAEAELTHPVLRDAAGERHSAAYAPDLVITWHNQPFPEPLGAVSLRFDHTGLGDARTLAAETAARHGFTGTRLDDIRLVIAELGANSLDHGGGAGTLRLWTEHGRLVCEVADGGHITDPLAGRRPADPKVAGSRGLLIVNLLSDLVRTHTRAGATVIRAYFELP